VKQRLYAGREGKGEARDLNTLSRILKIYLHKSAFLEAGSLSLYSDAASAYTQKIFQNNLLNIGSANGLFLQ
jgi:hypothetical protein